MTFIFVSLAIAVGIGLYGLYEINKQLKDK